MDRVALGISEPDRRQANWLILLLPQLDQAPAYNELDLRLPIEDTHNARVRSMHLPVVRCPSDSFNNVPYDRSLLSGTGGSIYARGNYGINLFSTDINATGNPNMLVYGSHDLINTNATVSGGGIAGVNTSLSFRDIPKGLSNVIGVDELRAGLTKLDPRGTWALGMAGASITSLNPAGPNPLDFDDGIVSCAILKLTLSAAEMTRQGMPCDSFSVPSNYFAASRSLHEGLVNCLFMDGSARSIHDQIDDAVWVAQHSRYPE